MGEHKKLAFVIMGGLAALFFITNNFYRPLLKQNSQLYEEYKGLKTKIRALNELSENRTDIIQTKLRQLSEQLDQSIPSTEKNLNITEQLTSIPAQSNISFTQINRLPLEEKDGYRVYSLDITAGATLYEFLRYLEGLDNGPLLITIDNLKMRKSERKDSDILNIGIILSGYQFTRVITPAQKFLEEEFVPIDISRADELLEPVKVIPTSIDLSTLKLSSPFTTKMSPVLIPESPRVIYSPEEAQEKELHLKGIAQEQDKKVALINDKIVKEGEEVEGAKVVSIERFKVVLFKNGKEFILELGK